jgi:hypothetical protein
MVNYGDTSFAGKQNSTAILSVLCRQAIMTARGTKRFSDQNISETVAVISIAGTI